MELPFLVICVLVGLYGNPIFCALDVKRGQGDFFKTPYFDRVIRLLQCIKEFVILL